MSAKIFKLLAAVVAAVITTSCAIETRTDAKGNSVTRTTFAPLAGVGVYSNMNIGVGRGCYGTMPIYNQIPQGCYPRSMQGGQTVIFRGGQPFGYYRGPNPHYRGGYGPPPPIFRGPPTQGTSIQNPVRAGQLIFFDGAGLGGVWVGG